MAIFSAGDKADCCHNRGLTTAVILTVFRLVNQADYSITLFVIETGLSPATSARTVTVIYSITLSSILLEFDYETITTNRN